MAFAVAFLLAPLAIYLLLVVASPGWPLRAALLLVGACIAYIWLGYLLVWQPLWTGSARADAYTVIAAVLYSIAFGVGAFSATFGRRLAARSTELSYLSVAIGILLITFLPLFSILGV